MPPSLQQKNITGRYSLSGTYKSHPNSTGNFTRVGGVRHPLIHVSTEIGAAPRHQRLNFTIEFAVRNEDAFTRRLNQIYTPRHTQFQKYLKPGEFAALHEPSLSEKQAVIQELNHSGITLYYSLARLLKVGGYVPDIETLFHTEIRQYQRHPPLNTTFLAAAYDLHVPSHWGIAEVRGLDTVPRPPLKKMAQPWGTFGGDYGDPPITNYHQLRMMYQVPYDLTGTGQTIAVLSYDSVYTTDGAPTDVEDFEADLMTGSNVNVPVNIIAVNGASLGTGDLSDETTLDVSTVIAMAPNLTALLLYVCYETIDGYTRIAADGLATAVTFSWAAIEGVGNSGLNTILQQLAAQGISVYAASGDSGCGGEHIPHLTLISP